MWSLQQQGRHRTLGLIARQQTTRAVRNPADDSVRRIFEPVAGPRPGTPVFHLCSTAGYCVGASDEHFLAHDDLISLCVAIHINKQIW